MTEREQDRVLRLLLEIRKLLADIRRQIPVPN
jgi:hypothetical protein